MLSKVCSVLLPFAYIFHFQDAMMALNSELQNSQGTIGELKTSVSEVRYHFTIQVEQQMSCVVLFVFRIPAEEDGHAQMIFTRSLLR